MTLKGTCLAALLILWGTAAQAAVVHLKDGRRLKGTVVSATAREVELHTPGGAVRIDVDRILRIDYDEGAAGESAAAPGPAGRTPSRGEARSFAFHGGVAVPLTRIQPGDTGGSSAMNGETGFQMGARYLQEVSPRLHAGMDFAFLHRPATDDLNLIPAANTRVSGDSFLAAAILKYVFTDMGSARPYVLAGGGINRTTTLIKSAPLPGFAWSDTGTIETRSLADEAAWGPAVLAGLGVDFLSPDNSSLGLELGWAGFFNRESDPTVAGRDVGLQDVTGRLESLTVALRWGWRF